MVNEKKLQESIIEKLEKLNLFPFQVTFSYAINDGILAITFFFFEQLQELLDKLDYKTMCDKSGFMILESTNTILLSETALLKFYTKI